MDGRSIYLLCGTYVVLSGCAGMSFGQGHSAEALTYYDPVPAVLLAGNNKCEVTATTISLPGRKRHLMFNSGLGSADLSVTFGPGGTLASVNSKTSGAVEDAMAVVTGLAGVGLMGAAPQTDPAVGCKPYSRLFQVVPDDNGIVSLVEVKGYPSPGD